MKNRLTAKEIIQLLNLKPLDFEGGHFTESYVSEDVISKDHLPTRYKSDKSFGTAIFYLLTSEPDSFSVMHKLPTDEIFHFYMGDPVELLELCPDGSSKVTILGNDMMKDQKVQYVVKRENWQGSRLLSGGEWALLGTTMAPGFTEDDFVLGLRDELVDKFPDRKEMIINLTRE